jgi:hypothetical protein
MSTNMRQHAHKAALAQGSCKVRMHGKAKALNVKVLCGTDA